MASPWLFSLQGELGTDGCPDDLPLPRTSDDTLLPSDRRTPPPKLQAPSAPERPKRASEVKSPFAPFVPFCGHFSSFNCDYAVPNGGGFTLGQREPRSCGRAAGKVGGSSQSRFEGRGRTTGDWIRGRVAARTRAGLGSPAYFGGAPRTVVVENASI